MIHLVQYSTGAGSAEAALRVVEAYGVAATVLMTADTMVEDEDNWRFAAEVWNYLKRPEWVVLRDGRTPMQVGRDQRVVPNNRMAVCSRVLKREISRSYIDARFDPASTIVYEGYDWTEPHRFDRARSPWAPFELRAPLMDPPLMQKAEILDAWSQRGIAPPALYVQGFTHANCGGGCVRSGQAQWALLLRVNPERYAMWEREEEETRATLDKNVAILRDRRGGKTAPLSLRAFRTRLQDAPTLFDHDDWGACGCDPMGVNETEVTIGGSSQVPNVVL